MPKYSVRESYVADGSTVDLHEDGFIVGRRPHLSGVKLLIAEPIGGDEHHECGAPTGDGTCGRTVKASGERCWQHD